MCVDTNTNSGRRDVGWWHMGAWESQTTVRQFPTKRKTNQTQYHRSGSSCSLSFASDLITVVERKTVILRWVSTSAILWELASWARGPESFLEYFQVKRFQKANWYGILPGQHMYFRTTNCSGILSGRKISKDKLFRNTFAASHLEFSELIHKYAIFPKLSLYFETW